MLVRRRVELLDLSFGVLNMRVRILKYLSKNKVLNFIEVIEKINKILKINFKEDNKIF